MPATEVFIFDTSCSSLSTQITRAEALAQALPFEDHETKIGDGSSVQSAEDHHWTEAEGPRKRRKLTDSKEMNDARGSCSPTPEIKVEACDSSQLRASPLPQSLTNSKVKVEAEQPKKKRPNQRTNNRAKLLWTDEETAELIKGVNLVGYGRWKKVLNHPDLHFIKERTSVDLKDRYRTCLHNGWATNTTKKPPPPRRRRRKSDNSIELFQLYPSNSPPRPDPSNTVGPNAAAQYRSTTPLSHPPSPRVHFPVPTHGTNESEPSIRVPRRKQKQPWTRKEDSLLWAGYKKHGFKWRAIANDDSLGLVHRRCTAIRDRFRLMLPSLYMDNVKIGPNVEEGGQRKMHWSLRKLIGRELAGPDPVLLALSEEGPGEEEVEAAFTDQEDEDGDEDDGDDENEVETNEVADNYGQDAGGDGIQQFEGVEFGQDSFNFDFSASEPLIQRFFNDEDFDLGYDEEADGDYFDDGKMENNDLSEFAFPPAFAENPPDFSELWNDNDEEGRDEDSEEGSEDEDGQGENGGLEGCLENGDNRGSDGHKNGCYDDRVPKSGIGGLIAAAPLLWEEMATQPIFDLEDDDG